MLGRMTMLPGWFQLEFLGDSRGNRPDEKVFTIASVKVTGGSLEWRLVDPAKAGKADDGGQLLARLRAAAAQSEDVFGDTRTFGKAPPEPEP